MKSIVTLLLCLPLLLFSQDAPSLYEVINIKAKPGQADALEAAIKAHNEKFHAEAPYTAILTYNINGPLAGTYSWIMGPTTWTALDDRPGEGDHDDDWALVSEHIESFDGQNYWSFSEKLSHVPEMKTWDKRLIWVYDIKKGKGARWAELVGKIKEVYEKQRPDENMWVVWNQFANTEQGWDAALIWGFDKWSWMDRESKFSEDYEAVHGEGSWHNFLNEFMETIDGRVDFIRQVVD